MSDAVALPMCASCSRQVSWCWGDLNAADYNYYCCTRCNRIVCADCMGRYGDHKGCLRCGAYGDDVEIRS